MEVIIAVVVLYWMGWVTFHSVRHAYDAICDYVREQYRQRQEVRQNRDLERQQRIQADAERLSAQRLAVTKNRAMQQAVLSLSAKSDPDFRRAAVAVQDSQIVPAEFRRRQFHRLRPLILRHFDNCTRRGCDPEVLQASLIDLVVAFGVEEFEAEYIKQESERNRERQAAGNVSGTAQFQARLSEIQRAHEERLEVIRAMPNLAEGVREQLLEAEERRFQEQLFPRASA